MAEIDDKELEQLRIAAKFLQEVEKTEGGAKEIQRLAKKVNPKIRTEDDVATEYAAPILDQVKKLSERLDGWDKRVDDYNREESWNNVKSQYGYTEDGMKSLREFADKNGIKNPKHAAAAWDRENPPAPVTSPYLGTQMLAADMVGSEEAAKMLKDNPLKFEEEQTRAFLTEARQRRAQG